MRLTSFFGGGISSSDSSSSSSSCRRHVTLQLHHVILTSPSSSESSSSSSSEPETRVRVQRSECSGTHPPPFPPCRRRRRNLPPLLSKHSTWQHLRAGGRGSTYVRPAAVLIPSPSADTQGGVKVYPEPIAMMSPCLACRSSVFQWQVASAGGH